MNDETLNSLVKQEEECVKEAKSLDVLLDTTEKEKAILTLEKAQKLEHEERRLRLDEYKHQLESDRLEYQRKQDRKENWIKIGLGVLTAAGGLLIGGAKLKQVIDQRKYVNEAYEIDQITTLTSKTARDLLSDGTNPKI